MKDLLKDANFPRTADQRVYHLGIRSGEVANRIITVGSASRAHRISNYLDATPKPFKLTSERGFMTITGRYQGIPISIISIGMGSPNMDFFVREVRESIAGDLAIIRLGSCGALVDVPVGSIICPTACVAVTRNLDFDFTSPTDNPENPPYKVSKPVKGDSELHAAVLSAVKTSEPLGDSIQVLEGVNASADSFYSSQGRQTSFADHNEDLIPHLLASTPNLQTLEMETHHLYYLAHLWGNRPVQHTSKSTAPSSFGAMSDTSPSTQLGLADPSSVIRASGLQIIFASRVSQDFISPEQVAQSEEWSGKVVLNALTNFPIDFSHLHPEEGSVWQL